ncbi:MAG: helix-hairpin-helix domain-containing protein [Motiliproteus sp.]
MNKRVRVGLLGLLMGLSLQVVAAVDVNHATAEQMAQGLKGIGLIKAQEIVRYRELHGPFQSVDQLSAVKGVGEVLIGRNRGVLAATLPEVAGTKK